MKFKRQHEAARPPTHMWGEAGAAEGAEQAGQRAGPAAETVCRLPRESGGSGDGRDQATGGKSSDGTSRPVVPAGGSPAVLPVFALRWDSVRLFCEGLLCAWLQT